MSELNRNLWVSRLTAFTAGMTLILLCAGALVTSTGSGLAVPDWPLSYGQFFPPMIGGILYEHGHRLIAGSVALLAVFQALVLWKVESRSYVKLLAFSAVALVLSQALLGGITVLFRLPPTVSISHACLAQIFFSTVVVIALMTSSYWQRFVPSPEVEKDQVLQNLVVLVPIAFFCQLIFGATMRHTGAGLAIPDFPLSFGHWIPPVFSKGVGIHFAHRLGAVTMTLLVAALVTRIYQKHSTQLQLIVVAGLLAAFVSLQIMMGALIIWLRKPVPLTMSHLAVGALCLASSVSLSVLVRRHRVSVPKSTTKRAPSFMGSVSA